MKTLKKAMVVCAAAGTLALAVPGIASADPGYNQGRGVGDYANQLCDYYGASPSSTYHGQCVDFFVHIF